MSQDWIKMRVDLNDDPAVIAMARALKASSYEIVGRLHVIWSWADRNTEDGVIAGVDAEWVDRKVEKRGFAKAMVTAGWLHITEDGLIFPRFDRHNGRSAKNRAEDTNRKREDRKRPEKTGQTSEDCPKKNRTKLGPEKRREEPKGSTEGIPTSEAGTADPPQPPPPPPPAAAPVPPWPIGLKPETWQAWKAHLGIRGKPLTPPAEAMALTRLCQHADPDSVVAKALASGHLNLPPVGGWPSEQSRAPPTSAHEQRQAVAKAIFGERYEGNGHGNCGGNDIIGEAVRL